jgi:hypothetical protein
LFLSIVVVAVGNINFALSILAFFGLAPFLFTYWLFKVSTEIERGNILLFKKPPKYYQYPPKQYLSDIETHNYAYNNNPDGNENNIDKIKCYFYAKYYDTKRSQLVDFQCDEDALIKGFCIFHEDDVSKGKENELDNTLNEKINKLIDEG